MIRSIILLFFLAFFFAATAPVVCAEDSAPRLQITIDEKMEGWMGVKWLEPVKKFEELYKDRIRKPSRVETLMMDIMIPLNELIWAYAIEKGSLCGLPCKAHIYSYPVDNSFANVSVYFDNTDAAENFKKILSCHIKIFGKDYKQRTGSEGAIWSFTVKNETTNRIFSPDVVITNNKHWPPIHKLRIKYGN